MRNLHRQSIMWRAVNMLGARRWVTVAGIVLLALVAYPLAQKIEHKRALEREIASLEAEAQRIESANQELEDMLAYLQGDAFAEREARLRLNMKKPGEQVVVVEGQNATVAGVQDSNSIFRIKGLEQAPPPKKVTNRERWWRYFFGALAQ